ncbi:MAG TPA: hypothetical protein VL961_08635 [Acidimicrobiales bacterium]|nr:hypothetical protein [Acidimicrobiales bacterium]
MTPAAATELALAPRPQPSPEVLAALAAAVELAWPVPTAPDAQDPVHHIWRFSGRWWNKPAPVRRERPWAQR